MCCWKKYIDALVTQCINNNNEGDDDNDNDNDDDN